MRSIGYFWERKAKNYLIKQGLTFVKKNYSCRHGEIDLIMIDSDQQLVFVEVKARKNNSKISGIESITHTKQQRIIKTASHFLAHHPQQYHLSCRFDIIEITYDFAKSIITWLPNAFQADQAY